MRARKSQQLEHESVESEDISRKSASNSNEGNRDVVIDMEEVDESWAPQTMQRSRRPPAWLSDYETEF